METLILYKKLMIIRLKYLDLNKQNEYSHI